MALNAYEKSKADILEKENKNLRKEIHQMEEKVKTVRVETKDGAKGEVLRIFDDIEGGEFKAYMDWRTITDRSSEQYKLQQKAHTGKFGIREINGRYCVAMGARFGTKVGREYTVEMANGAKIPVILADQKANIDTDATNTYDQLGGVVEFIVDEGNLQPLAKQMGDISYAHRDFYGPVKRITTKEGTAWSRKKLKS